MAKAFSEDNDTVIDEICQSDFPLKNEKFKWNAKKRKTHTLAVVYELLGDESYSERAKWCASALEFNFLEASEDGSNLKEAVTEGKKQLSRAHFCQLRLCPLCNARRSAKYGVLLLKALKGVKSAHPEVRLIFLTLTCRNVKSGDLRGTIGHLMKSWNRLMQPKRIKESVKGYFRCLEITYNKEHNTYHPHFHAILTVTEDYFKPNSPYYITQEEWQNRWKKALKVDYAPQVRLNAVRKGKNEEKSILEVTKYAVKDSDYLDEKRITKATLKRVSALTDALMGVRLVQSGGWIKEFWKMKDEDDLTHLSDEDGEKHSSWYGRYNFTVGMDKYILQDIWQRFENGKA